MFPIQKFLPMITKHEADRLDVYADSLGIWTVGRGFNLQQPGARGVCASLGIDYDAAMALRGTRKPAITEAQSVALFNHCANELLPQVRKLIPSFDALSDDRQLAIADVAWVGIGTMAGFHNMLAAINRGDWTAAAHELLYSGDHPSTLAKQWGHRAIEDAEMMRNG